MEQKEWETIEDEIAGLEQKLEQLGPEIDRAARDYKAGCSDEGKGRDRDASGTEDGSVGVPE